jgi:hypothetical protein
MIFSIKFDWRPEKKNFKLILFIFLTSVRIRIFFYISTKPKLWKWISQDNIEVTVFKLNNINIVW